MNKKLIRTSLMILCALLSSTHVLSGDEVESSPEQVNEQLSIERIFSSPALNAQRPKSIKFSSDGSRVTYLKETSDNLTQYDLWEYNLTSKAHKLLIDSQILLKSTEALSSEAKARRERTDGSDIMEYKFSSDGKALVFPLNGDSYYYSVESKTAKRLTDSTNFKANVKFSPQGNYVSFIRGDNLFVLTIENGTEKQLTKDGGRLNIKNGISEFIAQKQMDRITGYWWSPDEKHIAFLRVDESPIKAIGRNKNKTIIEQRYPTSGKNNVKIQLAVTDINAKKTHFIAIDEAKESNIKENQNDFYLPRVKWLPDSKKLSYQWQSRDQKTLMLKTYDLKKRRQKTLLTEHSDRWINLHHDLTFLNDNQSFIWASERDGYKHLYHYTNSGKLISQLTKGNWAVDSIKHVDETEGLLFFTGRADTPLERHLYSVPLNGKSPEHVARISKRNGFHSITFNNDSKSYIDHFSNISTPQQVSLHQEDGDHITWLAQNKITKEHPISPYYTGLIAPTFGTLTASDTKTILYYKLYKPENMIPGKKYPVIVRINGGPHDQVVKNNWQGADMTQYMLQQGYIVFQLDNRGSSFRGTAFEFPIHEELGKIEITDQITGVEYLHSLNFVDKNRIGIFGHSYGGYLTLMAMFKAGDYFKAGVSGASITDWLIYDTHYTERYLNLPEVNPDGYDKSSIFPYISRLNGPLMVYHGMADNNVLFTHTTKLIKALQDKGKLFELMIYPDSEHSMRSNKVQIHLHKTIMAFFDRQFK